MFEIAAKLRKDVEKVRICSEFVQTSLIDHQIGKAIAFEFPEISCLSKDKKEEAVLR